MLSHIAFLLALTLANSAEHGIQTECGSTIGEADALEDASDSTSLLQTAGELSPQLKIGASNNIGDAAATMIDEQAQFASAVETGSAEATNKAVDGNVAPAVETGSADATKSAVDGKKVVAEFLAMTLFVIIGCGTAMSVAHEPGWFLQVSLAFGLAITALAYTIGHYSGAQINGAVTFGLCIQGHVSWAQGVVNLVGQLVGSVVGALILNIMFGEANDKTKGLGTNEVNKESSTLSAFVGEFAMTFLLVYVVLECAVNPATAANSVNAPIAIGLAVFLAHCVLIPIDGCSINPTRSFGPLVVRQALYKSKSESGVSGHLIFWVGPFLGSAAAAGVYALMSR